MFFVIISSETEISMDDIDSKQIRLSSEDKLNIKVTCCPIQYTNIPKSNNVYTQRETEIGELVCAGLSNQEIASKLFVSIKTVKSHISNMLLKIDGQSRVDIVRYMYENKIIL